MDIKSFVLGQASAGGGGDITVESLSATENKTYTAPTGKAYSPVVVNVPGPTLQTKSATPTTSAQDVEPDSGYLLSKVTVAAIPSQYIVPTGTKSITENGTGIDVAQYAAVDVAVPSSGGSSWTLLHSEEIQDNYSSTTSDALRTIALPALSGAGYRFVCIRRKEGVEEGYFYGHDCFMPVDGNDSAGGKKEWVSYKGATGGGVTQYDSTSATVGIYVSQFSPTQLKLVHKYGGTSGVIDGTFVVNVYKLDYAPGGNPFS